MRILVAYASRHGATRGIAERIALVLERHGLDVTFRDVGNVRSVDDFDAFVIGSAAYIGRWERTAASFVRDHGGTLGTRPTWLFSSGPIGTEQVDARGRDVVETSRPIEFGEFETLVHPRDTKVFFGAYDPARPDATLAERLAMKVPTIRAAMPSGDFRDWPEIEQWADGIARALAPALVPA